MFQLKENINDKNINMLAVTIAKQRILNRKLNLTLKNRKKQKAKKWKKDSEKPKNVIIDYVNKSAQLLFYLK